MSPLDLLPAKIRQLYEVREWKHACAVLHSDFPGEWNDLIEVLTEFRLHRGHIAQPGGRKSKVAEVIDGAFEKRGWQEKGFDTKVVIDENEFRSPTHNAEDF